MSPADRAMNRYTLTRTADVGIGALDALLRRRTPVRYAPGEVLVRQGEISEFAYFVAEGSVAVYAESDYERVQLAALDAAPLSVDVGLSVEGNDVAHGLPAHRRGTDRSGAAGTGVSVLGDQPAGATARRHEPGAQPLRQCTFGAGAARVRLAHPRRAGAPLAATGDLRQHLQAFCRADRRQAPAE